MYKALIVPKADFTFWNIFRGELNTLHKRLKHYATFTNPSYESLYYQKLNMISKELQFNTLGPVHPVYYRKTPLKNASNPSGFGVEHMGAELTLRSCENIVKKYDVLIISRSTLPHSSKYLRVAKKLDKCVIVIDFEEDANFYNDDYAPLNGLKYKDDFDLYFKNHLRSGRASDFIMPMAPTPVNISMYDTSTTKDILDRDYSFFFSGILDKDVTYQNRVNLLKSLKEEKGSYIQIISTKNHYQHKLDSIADLHNVMRNSQFVACPAGRAWQTIRHTTSGIFQCVPVLPYPDIETVNFEPNNMVNGIYYPMLFGKPEHERATLVDNLMKELDLIKKDNKLLSNIANNWSKQVRHNHTTHKRAEYIVNLILRVLRGS